MIWLLHRLPTETKWPCQVVKNIPVFWGNYISGCKIELPFSPKILFNISLPLRDKSTKPTKPGFGICEAWSNSPTRPFHIRGLLVDDHVGCFFPCNRLFSKINLPCAIYCFCTHRNNILLETDDILNLFLSVFGILNICWFNPLR